MSSYFICATPRSGSWLLATLLESTGVAGRPHEYFWRDSERDFRRRWGVRSDAEYLARVRAEGTTPNGVFGAKLMWLQLDRLDDLLRSVDEPLERAFPGPRFVWLRRLDAVAQAVSFWRAVQTGRYHHWDPEPTVTPSFDFDAIDHLRREVEEHDAAWQRWLAARAAEPLEVTYEDMDDDAEAVVSRVLAWLGVDPTAARRTRAGTERQADGLNAKWAARYRALASG